MEAIITVTSSVRQALQLGNVIQDSNLEASFKIWGLHKLQPKASNVWAIHFEYILDAEELEDVKAELIGLFNERGLTEFEIN